MCFRNNCERDALLVGCVNSATSLYASIPIFSILGFKATTNYNNCIQRCTFRCRSNTFHSNTSSKGIIELEQKNLEITEHEQGRLGADLWADGFLESIFGWDLLDICSLFPLPDSAVYRIAGLKICASLLSAHQIRDSLHFGDPTLRAQHHCDRPKPLHP